MIASLHGSLGCSTLALGCLPGSDGTAALPRGATFDGLHWPEMLAAAGRNLFYLNHAFKLLLGRPLPARPVFVSIFCLRSGVI